MLISFRQFFVNHEQSMTYHNDEDLFKMSFKTKSIKHKTKHLIDLCGFSLRLLSSPPSLVLTHTFSLHESETWC